MFYILTTARKKNKPWDQNCTFYSASLDYLYSAAYASLVAATVLVQEREELLQHLILQIGVFTAAL